VFEQAVFTCMWAELM